MIEVEELKEYLGVTGTADDVLLHILEVSAVDWFESQADRYFGPEANVTEIKPGSGTRRLWLGEKPVTTPSAVFEVQVPGDTPVPILSTDTDGWEFRNGGDEGWLIRKNGCVWTKGYEYLIDYSQGYTAGNEPADVRLAITRLVAAMYRQERAENAAMKSESIDNYSYTRADFDQVVESDPFITRTLLRWRRPKI